MIKCEESKQKKIFESIFKIRRLKIFIQCFKQLISSYFLKLANFLNILLENLITGMTTMGPNNARCIVWVLGIIIVL